MARAQQKQTDPPAASPDEKPAADLPCAEFPIATRIEALLMSSDRALPEARLAEILGLTDGRDRKTTKEATRIVAAAIEVLNASYRKTGRSIAATRLAGGWQILTRPELGPLLSRLHADRQLSRLSQAALETLAIVSYRQPIIRAEIEAIRGVACGEVLRGLLERRLVKIVGRAEELGRPMLYGTTKEFLTVFGLANLDDLPLVEGLENDPTRKKRPKRAAPAAELEVKTEATGAADDAPGTPANDAEDAEPAEPAEESAKSDPDTAHHAKMANDDVTDEVTQEV